MADIVSKEKRSQMMSGIKSKNTKPELIIRSALHGAGLRFRLHVKDLPGKPDLVLPKYRAAIFVNGCFWHGHSCHMFKMPRSRPEFWNSKIRRNQEVDSEALRKLLENGWRVATIWECSLRGKGKLEVPGIIEMIQIWINSDQQVLEISGC
ncbi:very short patch repair endonuclease [Chitinophaga rhizosphaerae]|uniref:very short patch repair endonuclease n=1 Tax=Chitinophaga rhizosphaerae TaxID=1864947 RepID=UPI000F7FEC7F|nr:very short patch repair endonuclease [Chitinophaga rhizosphaerae]